MLNGNGILQPEMFIKIDIGPLFVFVGREFDTLFVFAFGFQLQSVE